jgi:23S rRNA (uracil1939-C5)-methyltransferase
MQKVRSDFMARQRPHVTSPPSGLPRKIDVTIEKLVYGGEGLAHQEGATVFVPFVLPSERVTVEPAEQKKKFVRARLDCVLEPSAERVIAACPHFGVCGGCDYQHIPYDAQLRYKTEILRETLRRIGKADWTGEIKTHGSEAWQYRNRAQWKVRPVGAGSAGDPALSGESALGIGYFRANSTSLCAVNDCPILSRVLLKTLLTLRDALTAGHLPRELREVEAFASEGAEGEAPRVLLTLTFGGFPSRAAEHAERIREIIPEAESLLFHDPNRDRMELFGPGFIEYRVGGRKYRVGHFSFFQVNRFLVEELAREAAENEPGGELALDLFAGVGLFGLPLAERFTHVIAVESNPAATRDLETNCRGKQAIEIRTADVEDFLQKFRGAPDVVVVDPGRAGLTPTIVRRLGEIAPRRITYVSCEPPTLARDLRGLLDGGYEISSVHLFDLFPQTFHMESIVRLQRRQ